MLIQFDAIQETAIPRFKGGEKELAAKMVFDGRNRILHGRLIPGASIGLHTPTDTSEILYVLSGAAAVVCDGLSELVSAGECHYCPIGSSHTVKNCGTDDLVFFAVVPVQAP